MNTIMVEKRNMTKKAKQLRRSGMVPCVIYGGTLKESLSVQMGQSIANKIARLKREGSKIQIKLDNQVISVQIKDKTQNLLTDEITHISFQALNADQKVNSVAHIILQNADKVAGVIEKLLMEVPYSAYPDDMIDTVTIDLEGLPVGSILTVGDIPEFKNGKVDLQVGADSMVLRIRDKKRLLSQDAG